MRELPRRSGVGIKAHAGESASRQSSIRLEKVQNCFLNPFENWFPLTTGAHTTVVCTQTRKAWSRTCKQSKSPGAPTPQPPKTSSAQPSPPSARYPCCCCCDAQKSLWTIHRSTVMGAAHRCDQDNIRSKLNQNHRCIIFWNWDDVRSNWAPCIVDRVHITECFLFSQKKRFQSLLCNCLLCRVGASSRQIWRTIVMIWTPGVIAKALLDAQQHLASCISILPTVKNLMWEPLLALKWTLRQKIQKWKSAAQWDA